MYSKCKHRADVSLQTMSLVRTLLDILCNYTISNSLFIL